jgi:hypothetical protein
MNIVFEDIEFYARDVHKLLQSCDYDEMNDEWGEMKDNPAPGDTRTKPVRKRNYEVGKLAEFWIRLKSDDWMNVNERNLLDYWPDHPLIVQGKEDYIKYHDLFHPNRRVILEVKAWSYILFPHSDMGQQMKEDRKYKIRKIQRGLGGWNFSDELLVLDVDGDRAQKNIPDKRYWFKKYIDDLTI